MVAVLGEKLFELVVLTLAFAPLLPQEFAGLVELPHADPNSATTATTPIIARISLLQGDEDWIGGRASSKAVSRPLSFVRPAPVVLSHWPGPTTCFEHEALRSRCRRLEQQVLRSARWRALRSE